MERLPSGFNIEVRQSGNNLAVVVGEDGLIKEARMGKITLFIGIDAGINARAIFVDGQKNPILKRNHFTKPENGSRFRQDFSIGNLYYPFNNLDLLHFKEGGRLDMWEIAVVAHRNKVYLATQMKYETRLFNKAGALVCPDFNQKWPALIRLIAGDSLVNMQGLPEFSTYAPAPVVRLNGLHPLQGRVLWWSHAMGIGALQTSSGAVRVGRNELHISNVRPGLPFLKPGELVGFKSLRQPISTRTQFEREACEVFLL